MVNSFQSIINSSQLKRKKFEVVWYFMKWLAQLANLGCQYFAGLIIENARIWQTLTISIVGLKQTSSWDIGENLSNEEKSSCLDKRTDPMRSYDQSFIGHLDTDFEEMSLGVWGLLFIWNAISWMLQKLLLRLT